VFEHEAHPAPTQNLGQFGHSLLHLKHPSPVTSSRSRPALRPGPAPRAGASYNQGRRAQAPPPPRQEPATHSPHKLGTGPARADRRPAHAR
jgi:hypothetical protein